MVGSDSLRLIPRSVILEPGVSSPWALSFPVTAGQAVVSDPATWCGIRGRSENDSRTTDLRWEEPWVPGFQVSPEWIQSSVF